jgi:hypothetical protein
MGSKMIENTTTFNCSAGRQRRSLRAVRRLHYGAIFCFKPAKVNIRHALVAIGALDFKKWAIDKAWTVFGANLLIASTTGESTLFTLHFG